MLFFVDHRHGSCIPCKTTLDSQVGSWECMFKNLPPKLTWSFSLLKPQNNLSTLAWPFRHGNHTNSNKTPERARCISSTEEEGGWGETRQFLLTVVFFGVDFLQNFKSFIFSKGIYFEIYCNYHCYPLFLILKRASLVILNSEKWSHWCRLIYI